MLNWIGWMDISLTHQSVEMWEQAAIVALERLLRRRTSYEHMSKMLQSL